MKLLFTLNPFSNNRTHVIGQCNSEEGSVRQENEETTTDKGVQLVMEGRIAIKVQLLLVTLIFTKS